MTSSGGGWGQIQYEMTRCVRWESENAPIMKDIFVKDIPILKGSLHTSYPYYGIILTIKTVSFTKVIHNHSPFSLC